MSALLVCSVGGHLAELHALAPRITEASAERLWVTFDTAQSRSLLADEDALLLDYAGSRDWRGILRHSRRARRLLRGGHRFEHAISTGSGIALSFLPWARVRGVASHYIESYTRLHGPSVTGRALASLPAIAMYTQHPAWVSARWQHAGSVFDGYEPGVRPEGRALRRVVVTLGTMRDYRFDRLLARVFELLPSEAQVLWQLGCTPAGDLPIAGRGEVPEGELAEAIAAADLVVAHCGCGSAMAALQTGKVPLLVPRRAARGENVDDHQAELGADLASRGLAIVREVEELDAGALALAARGAVVKVPAAPRFELAR